MTRGRRRSSSRRCGRRPDAGRLRGSASIGGGYTPAERWIVAFDDGSRAFAKFGTTELVADWLRLEHRAYVEIDGPFMPRFIGWSDGPVPVLVLEDLSGAQWPPPWQPSHVDRVLEALEAVSTRRARHGRRRLASATSSTGGRRIAPDQDPFLALGLVTPNWLDEALGALISAEAPEELDGTALLHLDVRSDNLCFRDDRALLVDWNQVTRGNPLLDVAAWLPSLALRGRTLARRRSARTPGCSPRRWRATSAPARRCRRSRMRRACVAFSSAGPHRVALGRALAGPAGPDGPASNGRADPHRYHSGAHALVARR